ARRALRRRGGGGGRLRRARAAPPRAGGDPRPLPALARRHPAPRRVRRQVLPVRLRRPRGLSLADRDRRAELRDRRLLLPARDRVHVHARAGGRGGASRAVVRGRRRARHRPRRHRAPGRDARAVRRSRPGRRRAAPPLVAVRLPHRGWLFDLDGTVYRGEALIPGAAETLAALRAAGRRVAFLSNKPLQTRADYAAKDRKSTRLNSSHQIISYAVFCLKKKKHNIIDTTTK